MKVHRRIKKKPAVVRPTVDSTTANLSARFFELGGANTEEVSPWSNVFKNQQGLFNISGTPEVKPDALENLYGPNPLDVNAYSNTSLPQFNYGEENPQGNLFSNDKPDFKVMGEDTKRLRMPVAPVQTYKTGITEMKNPVVQPAANELAGNYLHKEEEPIEQEQPFQFFNSYSGADAASSAHLLGQTFQNEGSTKNTLTGIAAGANLLAKIGRPMVAGMGYAKRNRESAKEIEEKNRRGMIGNYSEAYAEGGEVDEDNVFNFGFEGDMSEENAEFMPELLTGDYSTGSKEQPSNAEVEKNEYLKTPDGNVTKVVGDSHEEEGEDMNLPKGTRVISDHLTFNKEQIKLLKDDFDIKVSAKDTYAKGMDKIYQSIGLKDLIEEQEEIIESIKKIKEKAGKDKEDATSNVNLEFLSSKLKDIEDQKKPLQKKGAEMFDKIYKLQEEAKPKEKVEEAPTEFKIGGKVFSEADIYRVADERGIDKERALEIIKKFHDGGEVHNKKYGAGHPDSAHDDASLILGVNPSETNPDLPMQPFTDRDLKISGNINRDNFAEVMTNLRNQFPEIFDDIYDSEVDAEGNLTSVGLKEGKSNKDFQMGVNTQLDKVVSDIKRKIKDPTKQAEAIQKVESEKFGEGRYNQLDDIIGQETAGKKNFRLLSKVEGNAMPAKLIDSSIRQPVRGVEANLAPDPTKNVDIRKPLGVTQPQANVPTGTSEGVTEGLTEEQKARAKGIYMLPDQSPLAPGAFQPSLKAERRYGRIDPSLMTPDTQLTEIRRSAAEAEKQIANLPSGQREAALIGLQSNVQGQVDKVMNTVEMFNKQAEQQADAINLRQGDREEDARVVDLMSYEQRTLGALANTEDDYRRYWNEGMARNAQNFKTIEDLNLMNALYENFDITNDGVVVTGKGGLNAKAAMDAWRTKEAEQLGQPVPSTTTTKKKETDKKEAGGMVRKFKRKVRK